MSRGEADSSQADALAAQEPDTQSRGQGAFAVAPALAGLTAGAAMTHALVYRVLLPLLASRKLPLPTLLLWCAPFALNLAAVAGLISLTAGLTELVRARRLTDLSRRMLIAFLGCIVLSTLLFATFLPAARVNPQQVLVAAGALHTLAIQLAIIAARGNRSLSSRTTVALVGASSIFPLLFLVLRQLPATHIFSTDNAAGLHGLGELSYLLLPLAAAFVVVPWDDHAPARNARRAGAVAVALMAFAFAAAARMPSVLYGHILYSTLRLEWALERASLGYAVPVSLAVGAATAALVSRDRAHRQGGIGLWLWLAGGYNPLTPARILMTALAALLICRAALTVGALRPEGDRRD